jgi:hypothetical protein
MDDTVRCRHTSILHCTCSLYNHGTIHITKHLPEEETNKQDAKDWHLTYLCRRHGSLGLGGDPLSSSRCCQQQQCKYQAKALYDGHIRELQMSASLGRWFEFLENTMEKKNGSRCFSCRLPSCCFLWRAFFFLLMPSAFMLGFVWNGFFQGHRVR